MPRAPQGRTEGSADPSDADYAHPEAGGACG